MKRNTLNGNVLPVQSATFPTRRGHWVELEQPRRLEDVFGALFGTAPMLRSELETHADLSPDVFETKEEIVFVLPIPGIEPGELNIEATADTLSIRGERKPLFQAENAVQHRRSGWSAHPGAFHLSYTLPFEIDPNKVEAHTRNGILELHLPKAAVARPTTIKVGVTEN